MVFLSPPWARSLLPLAAPDDIRIDEFMFNERHGRKTLANSRNPFTCGITGRSYSTAEVQKRVDFLARALSKRVGWVTSDQTEWDRVACIYSLNTIDYVPLTYAVHRLNGIVTPASSGYSAQELIYQLRATSASVLFTCIPLLEIALEAAAAVQIPRHRIFLLDMEGDSPDSPFTAISALIEEGAGLPQLVPLQWVKGQGTRQVAYICFSSGTSGLPKGVMISHHNIISNVAANVAFEAHGRKLAGVETHVGLGILPFSHIYGLVIISHVQPWRGDEIIVLPKFNLGHMLGAVQKFRINHLSLVMAINIAPQTRAAPLVKETAEDFRKMWPTWKLTQGYGTPDPGLALRVPGVSTTSEHDILPGSCGSILPGIRCKLVDFDNKEVTELETPGELYVQGSSICLGYMNNARATAETFVWDADGRWLRTGDVAVIRRSAQGNEHIVVVDRIKELIKTKGHQVAPAELEAHLLIHPFVADCAVIPVSDKYAGEVPKAFVVRSSNAGSKPDQEVAAAICRHVEEHKAKYKWLQGIEFLMEIPKSPSGKILRRILKDQEKAKRKLQSNL
ncbi:phenylacetyl ligase [Fusarium mundagurra]|uniref:Phenylacetyl ligase n=1 Tax=Fusarium mundagurra TaxID=1567541 RepID=A0A8H5Y4Q4_9HYPO|nr:phenylacetyl ligase [Fusarium mundagurra]